jgi:hypothetical protein
VGSVDENLEPGRNGIYVMTVNAIDYDDPSTENAQLEYRITVNKELDAEPIFRIDPESGKIFLMTRLDRDLISQKEFVLEIRANDKGKYLDIYEAKQKFRLPAT